MDQDSLSEIVFGQLLAHKIVHEAVSKDMFIPPYDRGVELLLAGKPIEMITIKIGPQAVQAAYDAAQSTQGGIALDYVNMLEMAGRKNKLASRFDTLSKKLRQGDDVDLTEIIEQWNVMNTSVFDMIPMWDVQADAVPFIQSGWTALDRHLIGLPKTGLITIGGSPGQGKTTLLIRLVKGFLQLYPDKIVDIFTLEMPATEFKFRAVNLCEFTKDEQERAIICDQMLTVEEVSNRAARSGDKLGMVVIDFADLMVRGEMSEPEMAKIYLTCYSLAKRLGIPVVLISQLNRNYTGGIPRPTNLRYCITDHTHMMDGITGQPFTLEEIDKHPTILSMNENFQLVDKPYKISPSGKQPIYRIKTNSGLTLEVSEHHPIYGELEWVEVKDLKVGNLVATTHNLPHEDRIVATRERARLLGYMIGDGYIPAMSKGGLCWVEADPEVVEDFEDCFAREFPSMHLRKRWHRGAWKVEPCNPTYGGKTNAMNLWFTSLGVRGMNSYTFRVPGDVFQWHLGIIAEFLSALFIADGSVTNGSSPKVSLTSYSPGLLMDVKYLLLKFGIRSFISGHTLGIASIEDIYRFQFCIPMVGLRVSKLEKLQVDHPMYQFSRSDLLPLPITTLVREDGHRNLTKTRRLTRGRVMEFENLPEYVEKIVQSDIAWERVASIEMIGEQETYDVEVEDTHTFVAENIITHNTSLAEALSWCILMPYNPMTSYNSSDDKVLVPVAGRAYLICWKMRGGIQRHENMPGAISLPWSGEKGWGEDCEDTSWFRLKPYE